MVANATARQTRPWNPLKLTLRVKPPQRLFDFSQRAAPTPEPKVRFPNAYTFSTPPLSSLPQARKPYGPSAWHPRTTTLRQGAARRRPSSSRPDLRAMSSSPEANVHRRITTRSHDSGLHPSLFGPGIAGGDAVDGHVSAERGVQLPEGRAGQGDALDEHARAPDRLHHRGPQPADDDALVGSEPACDQGLEDSFPIRAAVPGRRARSVQRAASGDGHVGLFPGVEHRGAVDACEPFVPGPDRREPLWIVREEEGGASGQIEVDPAAHPQRAREEDAAGHGHATAAGSMAVVDRSLQRDRVVAAPISPSADERKGPRGNCRGRRAGEDRIGLRPGRGSGSLRQRGRRRNAVPAARDGRSGKGKEARSQQASAPEGGTPHDACVAGGGVRTASIATRSNTGAMRATRSDIVVVSRASSTSSRQTALAIHSKAAIRSQRRPPSQKPNRGTANAHPRCERNP